MGEDLDARQGEIYKRLRKGIHEFIIQEIADPDTGGMKDPEAAAPMISNVLITELCLLITDINDKDLLWDRFSYLQSCFNNMITAAKGSPQDGLAIQ
jgi:hypothetical protein